MLGYMDQDGDGSTIDVEIRTNRGRNIETYVVYVGKLGEGWSSLPGILRI